MNISDYSVEGLDAVWDIVESYFTTKNKHMPKFEVRVYEGGAKTHVEVLTADSKEDLLDLLAGKKLSGRITGWAPESIHQQPDKHDEERQTNGKSR